jgi:hypothetical protein
MVRSAREEQAGKAHKLMQMRLDESISKITGL